MFESLESRTLLSGVVLEASDVTAIVNAAASVSIPQQAIVVVDRNGDILAIYSQQPTSIASVSAQSLQASGGLPPAASAADYAIEQATARARTAAAFESAGNAFSTRTARFIIQDEFPFPINNTGGGPLYGVEFSSLYDSDVLAAGLGSGISGDPGGIPLYIDGQPVGAIGVAGDGEDVAPRADLVPAPGPDPATNFAYQSDKSGAFYTGVEEYDYDEAVALAGAVAYMPPGNILATGIFLDGIRLPFAAEGPATAPLNIPGLRDPSGASGGPRAYQMFSPLGELTAGPSNTPPSPYQPGTFAGNTGLVEKPILAATPANGGLTVAQVNQLIAQSVIVAESLRSAIRDPIGVSAAMQIAVVDLQGNILGVFAMNDAPLFSLDVAVQKARTAVFFSDDTHAVTTRAIGFLSQEFFPSGIDGEGSIQGPLYHLQDLLSTTPGDIGTTLPNGAHNPLANGITIFPGGIPLYLNGKLVGGLGISGDGVDQDDATAYLGSAGFQAPVGIQSDSINSDAMAAYLETKIDDMASMGFNLSSATYPNLQQTIDSDLQLGLDGVRLPYIKFPRNPFI
jgi:uncharacterized protein GlcG (DUF336 family)